METDGVDQRTSVHIGRMSGLCCSRGIVCGAKQFLVALAGMLADEIGGGLKKETVFPPGYRLL